MSTITVEVNCVVAFVVRMIAFESPASFSRRHIKLDTKHDAHKKSVAILIENT